MPDEVVHERWVGSLRSCLGTPLPDRAELTAEQTVALIVATANASHLLFPSGGGLSIYEARALERDHLWLNTGIEYVLRPTRAEFHRIDEDLVWSFLWIEVAAPEPRGAAHPLPDSPLLVCSEYSLYLTLPDVYDARHAHMSSAAFRRYVEGYSASTIRKG